MVKLKGIPSASPIGFMSALGLVRVLTQDMGLEVRLHWEGGHAVLSGVAETESLVPVLAEHMKERHQSPEWNWMDSSRKVLPHEYRAACENWKSDTRALAFLAAFGTDTALKEDGTICTSRLDMTSGQQGLLKELRSLAKDFSVRQTAEQAFCVALFGGGYDSQSSFGWDPVAVKKHAYEHRAPTKQGPKAKKGQVWLAAEGLPLHPVLPLRGRGVTTGCEQVEERKMMYFWPLWGKDTPLGLSEISLLRALSFEKLQPRSFVTEIWGAEFGSSGKYGILLPPKRLR